MSEEVIDKKTTAETADLAPETVPDVDVTADLTKDTGHFFRRIDWSAFWVAFLGSLALYTLTLAPTVTLEDSGELAVAADYLGVPHPPGYPIWTLLAWLFQWVFHWKTYYGQPNPAWAVGFLSAVSGALTCGILSLLVCRSGADMLRGMKRVGQVLGYKSEGLITWVGGVAAGFLLALSPGLWSQSVIVEVYSLNTLFLMIVLLLTFMWMKRPAEYKYLFALAFFFGLGLTNHQTLLFVGLAVAAAIWFRDSVLTRDFITVCIPLGILLLINILAKDNAPQLLWKNGPFHPTSYAFQIFTFLFIAIPVAAIFLLPKGKIVGPTILLVMLGVGFYLYLPFASEGNPPMNWAYPRTWEGFMHSITRGQYERVVLSDVFGDPEKFMGQLGAYFRDLRMQYILWISMMAMLPFTSWSLKLENRRFNVFYPTVALIVLVAIFDIIARKFFLPSGLEALTVTDTPMIAKVYKLFALGIFLLAGIGITGILINYIRTEIDKGGMTAVLGIIVACLIVGGLLLLDIAVLKVLFTGESSLILILMIIGPPILIGAVWWLITGPLELEFELPEISQRWLIVTIVSFFATSVLLIIALNHKLDIQTLFIGRVQLIQSHAVYAIWLGYGLIFALAKIETTFGGGKLIKIIGAALMALLPAASLMSNWTDETRIAIIGGTEQNGHDYGWQFGRYQLEGAEAIFEECAVKKIEPPPNPNYPPPMTENAIFYGGTDPGRFVPTYMIYSAKVRPDVFLITQNALADNTYMNVMRDLYGNDIWIPSTQDSNEAFQKYVKDVKEGRIQAGAAVTIKDGRVSVQGVQGVMTINGILAEEIFNFNKHKHDFYVEESYVIPWMYPYLEPHGLIMKINKTPIQITDEMIKNDREFWDWYTKTLMSETGFQRDVVARKTFSKLRSAIAGIYAYRKRFDHAIYAFQQAIELYPLSPEANFRLADIFMQSGRFQEAEDVIATLVKLDPGNERVAEFLGQIQAMRGRNVRREELEAFFKGGGSDIDKAIELIQLYQQLGRRAQFDAMVKQLLNEKRIPASKYLAIGQFCANAKRFDLLQLALQKFLEREPNNLRIWIDLAAVQVQQRQPQQAVQSLTQAVARGNEAARQMIRQDNRFAALRGLPEFQKLVPMPTQQQNPGNFNLNNLQIPGL